MQDISIDSDSLCSSSPKHFSANLFSYYFHNLQPDCTLYIVLTAHPLHGATVSKDQLAAPTEKSATFSSLLPRMYMNAPPRTEATEVIEISTYTFSVVITFERNK